MTDRELLEQALEALEWNLPVIEDYGDHEQLNRQHRAITALRDRLAQPEQEPVACEPQYANEDGWCDWVCPKPQGYLMQCCDCGLIHEVDSRVARYEPRPSEMFEVVDDPDLQVQWRMKRRDDISPKHPRQWYGLTDDEIALICGECAASAHKTDDISYARAIEAKLREKNA